MNFFLEPSSLSFIDDRFLKVSSLVNGSLCFAFEFSCVMTKLAYAICEQQRRSIFVVHCLDSIILSEIWNSQNCSMFPLAFLRCRVIIGSLMRLNSRNYIVWPILFLMNVFIALKEIHFWFLLFKPLASFCGCAGRFVCYLVANPEDRFSCDEVIYASN